MAVRKRLTFCHGKGEGMGISPYKKMPRAGYRFPVKIVKIFFLEGCGIDIFFNISGNFSILMAVRKRLTFCHGKGEGMGISPYKKMPRAGYRFPVKIVKVLKGCAANYNNPWRLNSLKSNLTNTYLGVWTKTLKHKSPGISWQRFTRTSL